MAVCRHLIGSDSYPSLSSKYPEIIGKCPIHAVPLVLSTLRPLVAVPSQAISTSSDQAVPKPPLSAYQSRSRAYQLAVYAGRAKDRLDDGDQQVVGDVVMQHHGTGSKGGPAAAAKGSSARGRDRGRSRASASESECPRHPRTSALALPRRGGRAPRHVDVERSAIPALPPRTSFVLLRVKRAPRTGHGHSGGNRQRASAASAASAVHVEREQFHYPYLPIAPGCDSDHTQLSSGTVGYSSKASAPGTGTRSDYSAVDGGSAYAPGTGSGMTPQSTHASSILQWPDERDAMPSTEDPAAAYCTALQGSFSFRQHLHSHLQRVLDGLADPHRQEVAKRRSAADAAIEAARSTPDPRHWTIGAVQQPGAGPTLTRQVSAPEAARAAIQAGPMLARASSSGDAGAGTGASDGAAGDASPGLAALPSPGTAGGASSGAWGAGGGLSVLKGRSAKRGLRQLSRFEQEAVSEIVQEQLDMGNAAQMWVDAATVAKRAMGQLLLSEDAVRASESTMATGGAGEKEDKVHPEIGWPLNQLPRWLLDQIKGAASSSNATMQLGSKAATGLRTDPRSMAERPASAASADGSIAASAASHGGDTATDAGSAAGSEMGTPALVATGVDYMPAVSPGLQARSTSVPSTGTSPRSASAGAVAAGMQQLSLPGPVEDVPSAGLPRSGGDSGARPSGLTPALGVGAPRAGTGPAEGGFPSSGGSVQGLAGFSLDVNAPIFVPGQAALGLPSSGSGASALVPAPGGLPTGPGLPLPARSHVPVSAGTGAAGKMPATESKEQGQLSPGHTGGAASRRRDDDDGNYVYYYQEWTGAPCLLLPECTALLRVQAEARAAAASKELGRDVCWHQCLPPVVHGSVLEVDCGQARLDPADARAVASNDADAIARVGMRGPRSGALPPHWPALGTIALAEVDMRGIVPRDILKGPSRRPQGRDGLGMLHYSACSCLYARRQERDRTLRAHRRELQEAARAARAEQEATERRRMEREAMQKALKASAGYSEGRTDDADPGKLGLASPKLASEEPTELVPPAAGNLWSSLAKRTASKSGGVVQGGAWGSATRAAMGASSGSSHTLFDALHGSGVLSYAGRGSTAARASGGGAGDGDGAAAQEAADALPSKKQQRKKKKKKKGGKRGGGGDAAGGLAALLGGQS